VRWDDQPQPFSAVVVGGGGGGVSADLAQLWIMVDFARGDRGIPGATSAQRPGRRSSDEAWSDSGSVIIIMKSSVGRDNNYCHYVILRNAGFTITLHYHPAGWVRHTTETIRGDVPTIECGRDPRMYDGWQKAMVTLL
jgi:hypothetical protein